MLTANWKIQGPLLASFLPKGEPLPNVEARCFRCGRTLGMGGWPCGDGESVIGTVLLEGGLSYDRQTGVWEAHGRFSKQVKTSRSVGPAARYEGEIAKPRHAWGSGSRYLGHDKLPPKDYPPGVVGKQESRGYPRWEVALPVRVRCAGCTWLNEIVRHQVELEDIMTQGR